MNMRPVFLGKREGPYQVVQWIYEVTGKEGNTRKAGEFYVVELDNFGAVSGASTRDACIADAKERNAEFVRGIEGEAKPLEAAKKAEFDSEIGMLFDTAITQAAANISDNTNEPPHPSLESDDENRRRRSRRLS